MSGPQFVHLQTFSRKANPAGQSVTQIFGELLRDPQFSKHVDDPQPPEIVDGLSPQELVSRHDAMVNDARVAVKVKGKTHHRAIRQDRHTLLTAVSSYPLTWDQIKGNPVEEEALRNWEIRNVNYFKTFFGAQYQATYRHIDEPHPHLHIYALPELIPGIDATHMHPGKRTKHIIEIQEREQGKSPREALAAANRALKIAMREFQDDYFRNVGEPSGLLRIGPRRQRLSRKDYQAQKHAARLRSASTLEARSQLIATKELSLRKAEEEMSENTKALTFAITHLRDLVSTIASTLGLGRFTTLSDALIAIQNTAMSLQNALHPYQKPISEPESETPTPI
jgi:hypothetical protein